MKAIVSSRFNDTLPLISRDPFNIEQFIEEFREYDAVSGELG